MSVRSGIVLLLALSTLTLLVGCGSSSSGPAPQAPPSGAFSNSDLSGTYVFSVSGADLASRLPYAIVGEFNANGNGELIAGTLLDINDANTAEFTSGPIAGVSITSGSYHVAADGRGQVVIVTNISGFPNLTFDFVLSSSFQGLITEADTFATGSGTLDLQSADTTPTGSYAFSLSGASYSDSPWATVGNFTLTGETIAGLDDLNEGGLLSFPAQSLSGSLVLGPSSSPATTLTVENDGSTVFSGLFDVFAIDATHLKFIEMDTTATLAGDAYSQTSTTVPTGTLAFTLEGQSSSGAPFAAGGFMVTTAGSNGITGTEDYNDDGSLSSASEPPPFSATYTATPLGAGRFSLGNFATFVGGTSYAAYPSSGGLLLLEIDNTGITVGAAYPPQTAGATLAVPQGYGLNLSGIFLGSEEFDAGEVDDIAEFTANSTGNTLTGLIDENSTIQGPDVWGSLGFTDGTYTLPVNGRGSIVATASNSSTSMLNGGFGLTFYTVDGNTFPFIESDSGQVATGVFVQQQANAVNPDVAHSHMFIPRPLVRPHAALRKKK